MTERLIEQLAACGYAVTATPQGVTLAELSATEDDRWLPALIAMMIANHRAGELPPDLVCDPLSWQACRDDSGFRLCAVDEIVIEQREEGFGRLFAQTGWTEARCERFLSLYEQESGRKLDRALVEICRVETATESGQ